MKSLVGKITIAASILALSAPSAFADESSGGWLSRLNPARLLNLLPSRNTNPPLPPAVPTADPTPIPNPTNLPGLPVPPTSVVPAPVVSPSPIANQPIASPRPVVITLPPVVTPNPVVVPPVVPSIPDGKIKGFEGSIYFSKEEKRAHAQKIQIVVGEANRCAQEMLERQQNFVKNYGVSAYYGAASEYASSARSDADNLALLTRDLEKMSVFDAETVARNMDAISCVGFVVGCLHRGFVAAHQEDLWAKLNSFVKANESDGTALQEGLHLLGWKIYYWNTNPQNNVKADELEAKFDPKNEHKFLGFHELRYSQVKSKGMYFHNTVDDSTTLDGFGDDVPAVMANTPFYVGTAHTGFHVFAGINQYVIEAHSLRLLKDTRILEGGEFKPWEKNGHPNAGDYGNYRSGLMAIPPGYGN